MMHGPEKSDPAIVATKPTNKAEGPPVARPAGETHAAEPVERRAGTKGNAGQQSTHQTQSWTARATGAGTHTESGSHPLCRHIPEVGAGCGKAARPDLCGGRAMKRTSLPLTRREPQPLCCALISPNLVNACANTSLKSQIAFRTSRMVADVLVL